MRVEIKHFFAEYYTVRYWRHWWSPFYRAWGKADISRDDPMLMKRNKLELFTLEDAKKLASSLTTQSIDKHEREQADIYKRAVVECRKKNRQRKAAERVITVR